MLTPEQLTGFLLAAVLITATPGPDNLMVLGLGVSRGRMQGMVFGLGCALGCLSHTLLAVLGVSALIAASPMRRISITPIARRWTRARMSPGRSGTIPTSCRPFSTR